jgi:membrane-bound acyltransferase YfiQ involved in biofilm formation
MAKRGRKKADNLPMFFSAYNYKLIGLAIFLVIAGFTAMYLENEVKGFISLYISPIVIMAGYILVVFAILKHDRTEDTKETVSS